MSGRPTDDDTDESGGLFDDDHNGGGGSTAVEVDNWYQPAGSVIGKAPTRPAEAPSARAKAAPAPVTRAPQRPPQGPPPLPRSVAPAVRPAPEKLDENESTKLALSPLLSQPRPQKPLAEESTRVLTLSDAARYETPEPATHILSPAAARAVMTPPAPAPRAAAPPVSSSDESTRVSRALPVFPANFAAGTSRALPIAPSGSDESTRISVAMPIISSSRTAGVSRAMPVISAGPSRAMPIISSSLPAGGLGSSGAATHQIGSSVAQSARTDRTPGPAFGASREARSKIIARGAGGSSDGATRVGQLSDLAGSVAPWRPTDVPRVAPPSTLAWEKEEGTVARLVSSLKVFAAKPVKSATTVRTALPEASSLRLLDLPFLAGIDEATLDGALAGGALTIVERGRDFLINAEAAAFLIVEGQVSVARFPKDALELERKAQAALDPTDKKAAKRDAKRRLEAGPLIRVAEQNLAFFEKGDLVHVRDYGAPPGLALGVYSVTPITGIAIRRDLLEHLQRAFPFFGDRVRRASVAARSRIEAVGGARSDVADFFIRHGLSVSQVLRVRAIDMCIECGACEKACEDRYGAKRLSLGGRKLGTLDFVDACHTCTDQRCIDPCGFDAIKYDTEKKEIVIIEAACTGCTLCATACPYAAIEMHDFEDKPLLKLRLESQGKLLFGDGAPAVETQFGSIKPRKAKAKRIASKCDHCIDYADQACISACPTGALVDVEPGDVFAARSAVIAEQADDGYDQSRILDVSALNDPRVFQHGLSSRQAQGMDKARALRPRIGTTWMWVVGICGWLVALTEIILRKASPGHSFDFFYMHFVEGLERDMALDRVDFHAGSPFALRLGYLGSALMFSGLLYPLRRRVPLFKNVGSQRGWFDVHVLTGVIGPLFVALHTVYKLDTWVASAVWAMVLTSITGIAGRYLFTQVPDWASSAALHARDVASKLDALRPRHPGVRALDNWLVADQKRVAAIAERSASTVALWLLTDGIQRLWLGFDLRERVVGVVDAGARRESVRAALLLAKYERHKILLPKIEPLCRLWKLLHVPAAIALTVLSSIHIVLALVA